MIIIPYQVDVTMPRWPIANWVILGAIGAVFALEMTGPAGSLQPYILDGWSFRGLFGHMWLHAGIVHALGNMVFLWTFGNAVCAKFGNGFYVLVYLLVGLLAGVAHLAFDGAPALGASGAINGVIGAFVVLYPLNTVSVLVGVFLWYWRRFHVRAFWLVLLWLVFDVLGILLGGLGVAYWAHIGGFAAGFALTSGLVLGGTIRMHPAERSLYQAAGWAEVETRPPAGRGRPTARGVPERPAEPPSTPPPPETPLTLRCSCGQVLKAPARFAGRLIQCPVCGQAIRVKQK